MGYFFYMLAVQKIFANIKKLDQNKILVSVLNQKAVKDFIIFQNTENQLRLGLDSKDDLFGLYSTFSYASFKQRNPGRKAKFGTVDLHLTGQFYRSFMIDVLTDGGFIIDADTDKGDNDLAERYGQDIIGLTDRSFEEFIDFILPLFIDATEKEIFQ